VDAAGRALDRVEHRLAIREVQQQRGGIAQAFLKRPDVDVPLAGHRVDRIEEIAPDRGDDQVHRGVDDDVVRETVEDHLSRKRAPGGVLVRGKVAEHQPAVCRQRPGVRVSQRVRVGPQVKRDEPVARPSPHGTAQSGLDTAQRLRGNGIGHLLMEVGIRLAGLEPATNGDQRIVEIHRIVETVPARVVVDDRDPLADRARPQLFVADGDRHHVAGQASQTRIERVDLQRPEDRRLDGQAEGRRRLARNVDVRLGRVQAHIGRTRRDAVDRPFASRRHWSR
jgi:hypothetical protein